ncbi:MAG: hypothetical protein HY855_15530 [Burkholderiales bacterium]|nr:hypothetical protein [Burkholderiales bacterium]
MSLASALASAAFAALPLPVRCPLRRKSEALREFEAFMAGPARSLPPPNIAFGTTTQRPPRAPG